MGKHEEALQACDRAFKLNPNDSEVLVNKANILIELNKKEEAVKVLDQALQVNPNMN